jgi:uncharacterized protein (DUF2164 family)
VNILILGNGFDLAHGLPTKYSDFLEFVRVIRELYEVGINKVNWGKLDKRLQVQIQTSKLQPILDNKQYWLDWIGDNIWVEYYNQNRIYVKENWIDFETEIANIIKSLDEDMYDNATKRKVPLKSEMQNLSNDFLVKCYKDSTFLVQVIDIHNESRSGFDRITFEEIRDRLLIDLKKLIRALEFYLVDYVEKLTVDVILSDIKGINIGKVLSFNYTDTYKKVYGNEKDIEYDFIHGQAELSNSIETTKMVLGIDEYLTDERRNIDVDFIAFKKFFQRIHKETGSLYKDWVEEIKLPKKTATGNGLSVKPLVHNLYIFGHSLDITDKDVLRNLILHDNVHTTIFYVNKEVYGHQIANLVKVLGQDELIKRTGGTTKTITFKQQSQMQKIEN